MEKEKEMLFNVLWLTLKLKVDKKGIGGAQGNELIRTKKERGTLLCGPRYQKPRFENDEMVYL